MKNWWVICGVLLWSSAVFAQGTKAKAFSEDVEKFPKEIQSFLQKTNKAKADQLEKQLTKVWESEFYSTSEKQRIVTEANSLVNIKVRNFPDFASFLQTIIVYPESEMGKDKFSDWFSIVEEYSKNSSRKKQLSRILTFSNGFFETKSLFRTQSKSVDWKVDSLDFSFSNEGNKVLLIFNKTNLKCETKGSEIELLETEGTFNVLTSNWIGNGGKVTFERAGNDPNSVWIDIFDYQIDMKHSYYSVDSVIYHNNKFLKEPLIGTLTDKVLAKQSTSRVSYPRFQSTNVHIPIKDLAKDVDYIGGFAQNGARIVGTGADTALATMTFYRDHKLFMKVTAKRFLMNINKASEDDDLMEETTKKKRQRNSVVSSKARVVIYMDGDSILHPGLKFNFYTDERLVNLVRVKGEMSETPYMNSFHNVEMRFELLEWNMDYPIMNFTSYAMSADKRALFESKSYFRESQYDNLMGASSWHPLVRMKRCATQYDTNVLSLRDITGCLQIPVTGVESMLYRYEVMGYLDYDKDLDEVTLYPKLFHQVNSKSEKEDYDVITVFSNGESTPSQDNATLNLMNFDLTIKGVNSIILSDNHNVKILPDSGTIIMKRNRDFDFNGIISSGKVDFYGHNFEFKYNDFLIEMPVLDSLQIWASTKEKDKQGYTLDTRVRTVIEDLKGDLKIDHPENKSGKEDIPEYPIFNSEKNSYAYYDKRSIFNKIYQRNDFYFELEPFEIDSLDKFTNEGISFKGVFYSAGILPDIPQNLGLQEDYSLGFKMNAPPGGFPLYGGKGAFKNEIQLSNKGLKGDGFINYLTSTAESKSFFFYPKEVRGITKMVEIEEQMSSVEYPNVLADTTKLRWLPYQDEYFLSSMPNKSPITMFGGNVSHTGRLKYTPENLTGRGVSAFEGAKLISDSMIYSFYNIHADTANFELGKTGLETLDFASENVRADVNFKDRKGEFLSNTGASLTNFGLVMYQAYLDRFTWFMDQEELELSAAGGKVDQGANDIQVEGAEFISVNPKQDSLRFYAKSARYSLQEVKLQARDVATINVADAEIIPYQGLVTIHEEAKMDRLDSSMIVANREFRYHLIYNASTQIYGKWNFVSHGKYDYMDENDLAQVIDFTTVSVDTTRQTFAEGIITSEDDFALSPMFRYKGNVELNANRKNLNFEGYGKLNHECENIPATWFSFDGEVDPDEIVIEINDEISNQNNDPLWASLMMPRDSSHLYGAFISESIHHRDVPICLSTGYLEFDQATREFRISNLQKLSEQTFPGNYVSINTKTCVLKGEGQLKLAQKTGYVEVQTVGDYSFNSIDTKSTYNTAMSIDFLFDESLLEMIIEDAKAAELEIAEFDNPTYELTLRELLGKEKADEMIGKMSLGKNVKIPDELRKTMFFSDLELKWNEETQSYISVGQFSIGNIGKTPVNMVFDGGIELVQKRGNTDITIYIEISPSVWYIFNYRASTGFMKVYSSNKEFLTKINEMKTDNKRLKGDKTIRPYQYIVGSKRQKSTFSLRLEDAAK